MQIKGRKLAVLGLGEEGVRMVKALSASGASVTGFGTAGPKDRESIEKKLKGVSCRLVWEAGPENVLTGFDAVVATPASGMYEKAKNYARSKKVPVHSILDFACLFMKAPIVAVTGTNGKSTTVAILNHLLQKQGYKVSVLGGDFGYWADCIGDKTSYDFYLLELSSARLEASENFHPNIALFLNLFPAHGDRHPGGLAGYFETKAKIFAHQTSDDFLIHEASAPNLRELIRMKSPKSRRVLFSLEAPVESPGIYRERQDLIWMGPSGEKETYSIAKMPSKMPTNILNFMAAIAAAKLCKVEAKAIQSTLDTFLGFELRLQPIRNVGGVLFVDDSRSTNVGSVQWALASFSLPIIWIAGGAVLKDSDLENLPQRVKGRVKLIILIGSEKKKLAEFWGSVAPLIEAGDLKEAVEIANSKAQAKDVVLYSPGCPPDLYLQGLGLQKRTFKSLVEKLPDTPRVIQAKSRYTRI